jgi:negative regulator of sigma E activity
MDDEADAFELRRVLDEACVDPELREEWQRFHLMRDLMHQEAPGAFAPGLRDAIWSELMAEQESQHDQSADVIDVGRLGEARERSSNSRWGPIAAGAIAATAALVVVLGGGFFEGDEGPQIAQDIYVPNADLQMANQQITAADRQRRNAYFVRHAQFRGMNQIGVASFAKVVTYDEALMQAGEERDANPAE